MFGSTLLPIFSWKNISIDLHFSLIKKNVLFTFSFRGIFGWSSLVIKGIVVTCIVIDKLEVTAHFSEQKNILEDLRIRFWREGQIIIFWLEKRINKLRIFSTGCFLYLNNVIVLLYFRKTLKKKIDLKNEFRILVTVYEVEQDKIAISDLLYSIK